MPPRPSLEAAEAELPELCAIASDVPQLWRDPAVTPRERKELVRCLVDRIVIDRPPESIEATVHWLSGAATCFRLWRRAGIEALVRARHAEGLTAAEIRVWLAGGDATTGQRWDFSITRVYQILRRLGLPPNPPRRRLLDGSQARLRELYAKGWTLEEIALRMNAEGFSTPMGRPWTPNVVCHWLGKGERRRSLGELHRCLLDDAKSRGLTNRQAADEFNAKGILRNGRHPWTADAVRQRRVCLNRRARRRLGTEVRPESEPSAQAG